MLILFKQPAATSLVAGASNVNVVDFGVVRTSGTLVPTNWAFPIGTNNAAFSSFWYFVDGRIRPTPKDAMREICAVGVPMSAVPDQSRLWRLDGDDGSRILTWENFFIGGDTNCPINAQIVLYPNGDFVTHSNDVETVCRRVNPDDWDDDGIANERDANPMAYDGDFFGVANALPPNANPDAYYWLDMSTTGALGVATTRVTCDGPSDLGDHLVIARTNHVCHIPLLAGASCAVDSSLPIDYSAVSTEYAEIVTNAENHLTVSLPLELTFERVQMRGGSDSYIAHSSPVDVGPRILNITGGCCSCDGTASRNAIVEVRNIRFRGQQNGKGIRIRSSGGEDVIAIMRTRRQLTILKVAASVLRYWTLLATPLNGNVLCLSGSRSLCRRPLAVPK